MGIEIFDRQGPREIVAGPKAEVAPAAAPSAVAPAAVQAEPAAVIEPTKRGRGRPRKLVAAVVAAVADPKTLQAVPTAPKAVAAAKKAAPVEEPAKFNVARRRG